MPLFALPVEITEVQLLELEDVDYFHEEILEPGQRRGYKRQEDLLGAIGRAQTALSYDYDADLIRIAAYYWHGIGTSHGYVDGNKRTALVSAMNFLLMNGVECLIDPKALGPWIDHLFETDHFTLDILEDMLRRHSRWR